MEYLLLQYMRMCDGDVHKYLARLCTAPQHKSSHWWSVQNAWADTNPFLFLSFFLGVIHLVQFIMAINNG